MFSALSLLPSAISDKLEKLSFRSDAHERHHQQQQQQPHVEDEDTDDPGRQTDKSEDTKKGKKKKKKRSTTNENFVIVRPPPAKTNHPLNLQVQLVPARHTRERSNTLESTTSTPTNSRIISDAQQQQQQEQPSSPAASESDHAQTQAQSQSTLMRTPSNRSRRSDFYTNTTSSMTSLASNASTGTTQSSGSGRRMIIPLYNLHAHNVMTNTILDAGTDERVAKFHKKGLEIIGLGILEPQEVWIPITKAGGGGGPGPGGSWGEHEDVARTMSGNSHSLAPPGGVHHAASAAPNAGSRPDTPDPSQSPGSSRLSLASEHSQQADLPAGAGAGAASAVAQDTTGTTPTPPGGGGGGTKKLFGKLFRKKTAGDLSAASSSPAGSRVASLSMPPSVQVQPPSHSHAHSLAPPSPTHSHHSHHSYSHTTAPGGAPLLMVDSLPPGTMSGHSPQASFDSHHSHSHSHHAQHHPPLASILGLTPTLHISSYPPHIIAHASPPRATDARAHKYIWPLKKWLKAEEQHGGVGAGAAAGAFVAGVIGRVAREASAHGLGNRGEAVLGATGWEVRWEWVKGGEKEREKERRRRERRRGLTGMSSTMALDGGEPAGGAGAAGSANASVRTSSKGDSGAAAPTTGGEEDGVPVLVESPRGSMDHTSFHKRNSIGSLKDKDKGDRRRTSLLARRSTEDMADHTSLAGGGGAGVGDESTTEDGCESDPEDSETPWTCMLVLQQVPLSLAPQSLSHQQQQQYHQQQQHQQQQYHQQQQQQHQHQHQHAHGPGQENLSRSSSLLSHTDESGSASSSLRKGVSAAGPTRPPATTTTTSSTITGISAAAAAAATQATTTTTTTTSGKTLNPNFDFSTPAPPAPTKIKIATLLPAPHHPKVVCQLRIPFPLPDVEVSRGTVRKRVVLPDGTTRTTVGTGGAGGGEGAPPHPGAPAQGHGHGHGHGLGLGLGQGQGRGQGQGPGLVLTAEEIKDVICATACWMVVREGIGGVGKVNRKGDGWRIRG